MAKKTVKIEKKPVVKTRKKASKQVDVVAAKQQLDALFIKQPDLVQESDIDLTVNHEQICLADKLNGKTCKQVFAMYKANQLTEGQVDLYLSERFGESTTTPEGRVIKRNLPMDSLQFKYFVKRVFMNNCSMTVRHLRDSKRGNNSRPSNPQKAKSFSPERKVYKNLGLLHEADKVITLI